MMSINRAQGENAKCMKKPTEILGSNDAMESETTTTTTTKNCLKLIYKHA